jgi:hypothetical protein
LSGALTLAWVEGTYLGTTIAISRHEQAAPAGLGGRARATMVVDDAAVRWERQGSELVRVAGPRLLGASVGRGLSRTLLGRAQLVLVEWSAADGSDDDRCVTRFQPRARADSAVLVSAVQRLMEFGPSLDDPPTTPDGTP